MFGYVNVNQGELKVRELALYKSYYCGLCRVLKERFGRAGQLTLNYDTTFLAILLSALYESEEHTDTMRCALHPTKKRPVTRTDYMNYAADMTIVLTWHQLRDHWKDDRSVPGLAGSGVLTHAYRKLEQQYPRQCVAVEAVIEKLTGLEQAGSTDIDAVAGCSGEMLQELFVVKEDMWADRLRRMGRGIGKFVYVMDAYEDLPEDLKKGRYNPLKELAKQADYEDACEEIMRLYMAEAAAAFEELPILMNAELLRNILYAGVWTKHDRLRKERTEQDRITGGKNGSL